MSDFGEIEAALTGRLTTDPAQRTSKAGKEWLSLNVAVGSGDAAPQLSQQPERSFA